RVAADTSIVNALRAPDRPLSLAARRALIPITTRADSITPPELWTPQGRAVGTVTLELPHEAAHVRDEIRALATANASTFVSKFYSIGGHTSSWQAVPVRDKGELLGFIVQERRSGTNARTIQTFRDLIGSDIDLYYRNSQDNTWLRAMGGAPLV